MSDDEHGVRVTLKYAGRTYGVIAYPSGTSTLDVDGRFVCNADWNGRVIDPGLNDIHHDPEVSYDLLVQLGELLKAAQGPDAGSRDAAPGDGRKRGSRTRNGERDPGRSG